MTLIDKGDFYADAGQIFFGQIMKNHAYLLLNKNRKNKLFII